MLSKRIDDDLLSAVSLTGGETAGDEILPGGGVLMSDASPARELWILGVDDCAGRGKIVCSYLKAGGYKARTARMEELSERKPFGIVLDLSPYSSDGWSILLGLKKNVQTRDIPILPLYLSEEGKVGGVFPVAGFFTLPIDDEYLKKRLVVLGLVEDVDVWDLQALIVSKNGEEQVAKTIESLGFEVVNGYTGKEGIALATTESRYMAFATLMLPDMSAFELMERFRLYPYTKNLPFFVLVKDSMKEGERAAMGRQVEHLVRKKDLSQEEFLRYLRKR